MSLLVHLPLNGTLENKGLSNINMTGTPAYDDNGKIGKCVKFDATLTNKLYDSEQCPDIKLTEELTYCLWLNNQRTSEDTGSQYAFTVGRADGSTYGYGVNVRMSSVLLFFGNTSYNISITNNTWTHIAFTKKGNQICTYKNGQLVNTYTFSGTLPEYTQYSGLGLGYFKYSSYSIYPSRCSINDFRIYDHCLSPKEVKEISKGLVVHYPLNDIINPNLLPVDSQRMTENGSTAPREYMYLCSTLNIFDTYGLVPYTISFEIKAAVDHSFSIYGDSGTGSKYLFSRKSINVTTEWKRFSYTFTPYINNSSGTWAGISVYGIYDSGAIVSVRKVKLELGSIETPLFTNNDVIYDCSGYSNHGTITGNLSVSNDSPRYCESGDFFSSETNGVITSQFNIPDGPSTISLWFNPNTKTSNKETPIQIFSRDLQFWIYSNFPYFRYGENRKYKYINYWSDNNWHFITCVSNNNDFNIYIDGNIIESPYTVTETNQYRSNLSIYGRNSKLSDFRIYTTALSDADIKELYDTSAFITNNGTLESYEFVESEYQNILSNWTDVSLITMNGWSGAKEYNSNGYLTLTATNGWRTFGWDTSTVNGQQILVDFDYEFISVEGLSYNACDVQSSCNYINPNNPLDFSTLNEWKHFRREFTANDYFTIMLRVTDDSGKSTTVNIKNLSIIVKPSSNANVNKNGIFQSSIFKEGLSDISISAETVNTNQLIEI